MMSMELEGMNMGGPHSDTTTMNIRMSVLEALPEGGWLLEGRYLGVEIDDPTDLGVGDWLERMRYTIKMRPNGETFDLQMDPMDDVPEGLREMHALMEGIGSSLGQMEFIVPETPLGLGARWSNLDTVDTGPLLIHSESDYEILAMDSEGMDLRMEMRMDAPRQPLGMPEMPTGSEAILEMLQGRGEGLVRIRGDLPMPLEQTLSSEQSIQMMIYMGGEQAHMTQQINLTMEVKTIGSGSLRR